jgi:hypothetical protein
MDEKERNIFRIIRNFKGLIGNHKLFNQKKNLHCNFLATKKQPMLN